MKDTDADIIISPCRRCGCDSNPDLPVHSCPFQVEINDDRTERCRCCADCEQRCIDSI